MKLAGRAVVVVVALVCVGGVVWMVNGPAASTAVVGNANVVGGVAGVLALLVAVGVLWPRAARRRAAVAPVAGRGQAAADYLAGETLRSWRAQAVDQRITTPSPAAVRWGWASEEVAVPASELQWAARC